MDILKKILAFVSKYRYAVLVLAIGLILMLIPTGGSTASETVQAETAAEETVDITQELTEILSQIQGVGKVKVMLTQEAGQTTVYQSDPSSSGSDTIIITDANRAQSGLVQQITAPTYRGAIVVCQGADSAAVRLNVIEAVSKVTGLSTDKISVLKMK